MLLLVSLTEERAIYLGLVLDRSWTEMDGVNPLDGTNYLDTASAFTCESEKQVAACDDRPAHRLSGIDHVYWSQGDQLGYQFRQLKSSSRLELVALIRAKP